MQTLHDQLRAMVNQAFPAGLPLSKKTFARIASGGSNSPSSEGVVYEIYNRCTSEYFPLEISINSNDELSVNCNIPAGHDYDKELLLSISHRLNEAKEKPAEPGLSIDTHEFLNRLADIVGAKTGFKETEPNDKFPYYRYKAIGSGGRIVLVRDTKKWEYRISYRSGPAKRDDVINMVDFEHGENYIKTIEKAAAISKVWHIGAVDIVQDYLNRVPVRSFRHQVQERPSYQYDFPFCDIVLKDFPDVCLLRVTHEGFKMWRDGVYVTITDPAEIETAPIMQSIEGWPQAMWRLGAGILHTTGTFEKLPLGKMKFTPSNHG
jgi:hypothetical protein